MSFRKVVCSITVAVGASIGVACSESDPAASLVGADVKLESPQGPWGPRAHRSFTWTHETGLHVIALPARATSMDVTALNDEGQAAGYVTHGEGTENYRAFTWSESAGYTAIGSLSGPDGISLALSISGAGEVMGVSEGPSTRTNGPMGIQLGDFFSWTAHSGMRPVPHPTGFSEIKPVSAGGKLILPDWTNCYEVAGANDIGQAIGYAGFASGNGCRFTVALMWDVDGKPVRIADCGSTRWCGTTLNDVNNRGEVVGYRESAGFRWTSSGGLTWIPKANAALYSINDKGDAAGMIRMGDVSAPVVWMASGETRMIELPDGATYGFPVAINDRGQVVGNFK